MKKVDWSNVQNFCFAHENHAGFDGAAWVGELECHLEDVFNEQVQQEQ
jgi:hypothetical protein